MSHAGGRFLKTGPFETHFHECGSGCAVLMLHGSGPGVSAWANWSGNIAEMGAGRRVIAPDMAGYGYTRYAPDTELDIEAWRRQIVDLLDALKIDRAVMMGNSFGGMMSLVMAIHHPNRVAGLVLMGTPAGEFELSPALLMVRSYTPSLENMRKMLLMFPVDPALVTEEMVVSRHEMSLRHQPTAFQKQAPKPDLQSAAMSSAPVKIQATPLAELAGITAPTLIVHGREDRVLPPEIAFNAHRAIPNSDLIIYGRAGHWAQIERRASFNRDARAFLDDINWRSA